MAYIIILPHQNSPLDLEDRNRGNISMKNTSQNVSGLPTEGKCTFSQPSTGVDCHRVEKSRFKRTDPHKKNWGIKRVGDSHTNLPLKKKLHRRY